MPPISPSTALELPPGAESPGLDEVEEVHEEKAYHTGRLVLQCQMLKQQLAKEWPQLPRGSTAKHKV